MKRHSFIREESLRPEIPFRDCIIFDDNITYVVNGKFSGCHLTLYQKNEIILAISHESGYDTTIGESAREIRSHVKRMFTDKNIIFIQGYDGFYEYVKKKPIIEGFGGKYNSLIIAMNQIKSAGERFDWSPAGSLQEVLERHLQ